MQRDNSNVKGPETPGKEDTHEGQIICETDV